MELTGQHLCGMMAHFATQIQLHADYRRRFVRDPSRQRISTLDVAVGLLQSRNLSGLAI